jgi:hypothetical protein
MHCAVETSVISIRGDDDIFLRLYGRLHARNVWQADGRLAWLEGLLGADAHSRSISCCRISVVAGTIGAIGGGRVSSESRQRSRRRSHG